MRDHVIGAPAPMDQGWIDVQVEGRMPRQPQGRDEMGSVFKLRVRKGKRQRTERQLRPAPYCIRYRDERGRWIRESAHTGDLDTVKERLREREEAIAKGRTVQRGTARFGEVADR